MGKALIALIVAGVIAVLGGIWVYNTINSEYNAGIAIGGSKAWKDADLN